MYYLYRSNRIPDLSVLNEIPIYSNYSFDFNTMRLHEVYNGFVISNTLISAHFDIKLSHNAKIILFS